LAAYFGVSLVAVLFWKQGKYYPDDKLDTPVRVIDWVERGKPVKMVPRAQLTGGLFSTGG